MPQQGYPRVNDVRGSPREAVPPRLRPAPLRSRRASYALGSLAFLRPPARHEHRGYSLIRLPGLGRATVGKRPSITARSRFRTRHTRRSAQLSSRPRVSRMGRRERLRASCREPCQKGVPPTLGEAARGVPFVAPARFQACTCEGGADSGEKADQLRLSPSLLMSRHALSRNQHARVAISRRPTQPGRRIG